MTDTLITVSAVIIISAILSLGSMGIFYFIRKRGSRRNRLGLGKKTKCEYIIEDDISNGRELNQMPAISYSRYDSAPADYHYVTEHVSLEPLDMDTSLKRMTCCQCLDDCSDDSNCECIKTSQCGKYYDSSGRLNLEYVSNAFHAIRECNIACKCNPKYCKNMVIQGGCRLRLVLFKTKSRGWGVRTLEDIKRGTFIGVYSGELVPVSASQCRQDDTYLFNLANTIIRYENKPKYKEEVQPQQAERTKNGQEVVEIGGCANEAPIQNNDAQVLSNVMDIDQISGEPGASGGEHQAELNDSFNSDKLTETKVHGLEQEYAKESLEEEWDCVSEGEHKSSSSTMHEQQVGGGNLQEVDSGMEPEPEEAEQSPDGSVNQQQQQQQQYYQREEYFICDAKFYGNFTRFINHSCEPNVIGIRTFTTHQDNRFPYISFFSNQDIQAGEELTLNYGDNYWLVKCKRDKVFCLCKKPSCKFTKKTLNRTLRLYYEQRQHAANNE